MNKHAQGPLLVTKSKHGIDGGHSVVAAVDNGTEDMTLLLHTDGDGGDPTDNARRLVACWNALVGVDTDFIKRVPQTPGFDIIQLLTKERDELLAELRDIHRIFAEAEFSTPDHGADLLNEILDTKEPRLRTLLAKFAPKVPAPQPEQRTVDHHPV